MAWKDRRAKLNKKDGFSMVELIVVIVILMILAGALVVGVAKWINFSHFAQQNEYAATLFMAAQNQLSDYDANGLLKEVEAKLSTNDEIKPSVMVPKVKIGNREALDIVPGYAEDDSQRYYLDELWPQSSGKDKPEKYRGDVVYLMGTAETYQLYQKYKSGQTLTGAESDLLTEEVKMLYDILLPYIYDQSILQAAVCLEFSPSNGQVFALLYSNDGKNAQFTYDPVDQYANGSSVAGGITSIQNRRVEFRQKRSVGYYGVDTLSKVNASSAASPTLTNVTLNNEDTLNLSFRLSRYKDAIKMLTYRVVVYDKETNAKRLSIVMRLPGRLAMGQTDMESAEPVTCSVTRYSASGQTLDTREYPFLVWLEDNYAVRMVLDAADESANSFAYEIAKDMIYSNDFEHESNNDVKIQYAEPFLKTLSFHRFGIDVDSVYCSVSAGGDIYAFSNPRKSNESCVYFAKEKVSDAQKEYELQNGRHLNNVRYLETEKETLAGEKNADYLLKADINWSLFAAGALYNTKDFASGLTPSMRAVLPGDQVLYPFVSIRSLRNGSTFESEMGLLSDKKNVISEIYISEEKNAENQVYFFVKADGTIGEDEVHYSGLFAQNFGTVKNIQMDGVQVNGETGVGAVCGANGGNIEKVVIQSSFGKDSGKASVIRGKQLVGGVFGVSIAELEESTCLQLVNYATVQGERFVGGITGKVVADDDHKVVLEECKNYGVVEGVTLATKAVNDKLNIRYIGGIAGLCLDNSNSKENQLVLKKCIASPVNSAVLEIVNRAIADAESGSDNWEAELDSMLNGVFVGGIVGYNQGAVLDQCSTENYKKVQTYILGYRYVGGIVGYNAGETGSILSLDGAGNVNEANILGDSYVGGIAGCNGDLDMQIVFSEDGTDNIPEDAQIPEAVSTGNTNKKITDWVNKGIVCAKDNYAGGICGYNAGLLENCKSEVKADNNALGISSAKSLNGDYIGGIAGYNNGIITAGNISESKPREIAVISYVNGKNFVGGIVGYNDEDAVIENYSLSGGYINGIGNFVGGFVGLNKAENLISDKVLASNPNRVVGQYFVGGSIGGNIVAMKETMGNVAAELRTDNFLGLVSADAFAGGFIGYNHQVKEGSDTEKIVEALLTFAETTYEELPAQYQLGNQEEGISATELDAAKHKQVLLYMIHRMEEKEWTDCQETDLRFTVQGAEGQDGSASKFGGITAKVYVGGVIGYNNSGTALTIKNVLNKSKVTATTSVVNAGEAPSTDAKYQEFRYAYAGGVIGKVGPKVVVDHCNNAEAGDVISTGSYLGGVCEINEGLVINCQATSIGSRDKSYVGGVVGLNKSGGRVESVALNNNTITGKSYVGGIAAENYGDIKNVTITKGTISGGGEFIGGVTGVNYGKIYMMDLTGVSDASGKKYAAEISIQGEGTYVGGLVGYNRDILIGVAKNNQADAEHSYQLTAGNVHGKECVGGVVGANLKDLSGFENQSDVNATEGEVGGIAGRSSSDITNCVNGGEIIAMKSGNAGGIVAHNNSTIAQCRNTGSVTASNGDCGGIAGDNTEKGLIDTCEVYGRGAKNLLFEGLDNIGGICARNDGEIKDTTLRNVTVSNTSKSAISNIGIMTGINTGRIHYEDKALLATDGCIAQTYKNKCYVGGIAGINSYRVVEENGVETIVGGEISDATLVNTMIIYAGFDLSAPGKNQYAQCSANYGNLGGITGLNDKDATIQRCNVKATVYGDMGRDGFSYGGVAAINRGNVLQTNLNGNVYGNGSAASSVLIGGIVGENEKSGVVEECHIGTEGDSSTVYRVMSGYTVSITYAQSSWNTQMTDSYGLIGGIVGRNSGVVRNCDNYKESKATVLIQNGPGTLGGIVGYMNTGAVATGTAPEKEGEEPKYLSTGKYWKVLSWVFENDTGAGGIMGYSKSGENVCYVRNYAVTSSAKSNKTSATGGLIGRHENKEVANMQISFVNNYAPITGGRAGGLIGRTKYMAPAINNCINYGDICCDSEQAGGLVGSAIYSDVPMYLTDCMNFGKVYGKGIGGGIIGETASDVIVENCVNMGMINSEKEIGGIAPMKTKQVAIYNCRNYANSEKETFGGIFGATSTNDTDARKVYNCFSIGQSGIVADSAKLAGNFNMKPGKITDVYTLIEEKNADIIYLDTAAPTKVASGATVAATKMEGNINWDVISGKSGRRYVVEFSKTTGAKTIQLNLAAEEELSGLAIKFSNDDANVKYQRTYRFKVSFVDKSGKVKWLSNDGQKDYITDQESDATVYSQTADMYAGDSNIFKVTFAEEGVCTKNLVLHFSSIQDLQNNAMVNKTTVALDNVYVNIGGVDARLSAPNTGVDVVTLPDEQNGGYKIVRADEYTKNKMNGGEKTYSAYIPDVQNNPEGVWTDFEDWSEEAERYKVYLELDKKVVQFLQASVTECATPTSLAYSYEGDTLRIKWGHSAGGYYRDILVYRIYGTEEWSKPIEVPLGVCAYRLPLQEEWYGQKLEVAVCSTNGLFEGVESVPNSVKGKAPARLHSTNTSNWALKNNEVLKIQLPVARVHLELGAVDKNGICDPLSFVAVLENPEDYEGDKATSITATSNGITWTINTAAGDRSDGKQIACFDNKNLVVQANSNSKYAASVKTTAEYACNGTIASGSIKKTLLNTKLVNTTFQSFYGDRMDTLYYQLKTKYASDRTEHFINAELEAKDYNIGEDADGNTVKCDLVLAKGFSHVATNGSDLVNTLKNLPDDFLDGQKITARTYPWVSQAYAVYYGHYVKQGISKEELVDTLFTLVDKERKTEQYPEGTPVYLWDEATKTGHLSDGYVLYVNEEKEYEIYYSTFLARNNGTERLYELQVAEVEYTIDRSQDPNCVTGTVGAMAYNVPIRRTPVIKPDDPLSTENGEDFIFSWDEGMTETSAVYDLLLYGYSNDGTEVLLEQCTVGAEDCFEENAGCWQIIFKDKASVWEYTKYRLKVTRVGAVTATGTNAGQTTYFPANAEQMYTVKQRLPQITRPTVELVQNDGKIDKNSLTYTVSWNCVEAALRQYVEKYEINVQPVEESVVTYTSEEEYQKVLDDLYDYYDQKNQVEKEEDDDTVIYTWEEQGALKGVDYQVTKEVTITADAVEYTIAKSMVEKWLYDAADLSNTSNATRLVDLNDYDRGQNLLIDVQAKAFLTEECPYRDGPAGVAREVALPDRLVVPDVKSLSENIAYNEEEWVDQETLEQTGIVLTMEDDASNIVSGKYQIAVAVVEEALPDSYAKVANAGDAEDGDGSTDRWNSGARETIYTKQAETEMAGDFALSDITVHDLKAEYAGLWLKIAMRAVADSNISSWWSDEDEAFQRSVNYAYIRLPRVRMNLPVVKTVGTTSVYYDQNGNYSLSELTEGVDVRRADQTTVQLVLDPLSDMYVIERVRKGADTKYGTAVQGDWIYLQKDENGDYQVFVKTTEKSVVSVGDGQLESDADAVMIGMLSKDGGVLALPFEESVQINAQGMCEKAVAFLKYDCETETFAMILPDAETMSTNFEDAEGTNLLTSQISVQACVTEENIEKYEPSEIVSWYRSANAVMVQNYEEKTQTADMSLEITKSQLDGVAYEVKNASADCTVYKVEVLGNDQTTVLAVNYMSAVVDAAQQTLYVEDAYVAGYNPEDVEHPNYMRITPISVNVPGPGFCIPAQPVVVEMPVLTVNAVQSDVVDSTAELTYEENGEVKTTNIVGKTYLFEASKSNDVAGYQLLVKSEGDQTAEVMIAKRADGWYLGEDKVTSSEKTEVLVMTGALLETKSKELHTVSGNSFLAEPMILSKTAQAKLWLTLVENEDGKVKIKIEMPSMYAEVFSDARDEAVGTYHFYDGFEIHTIATNPNYREH